MPSTILPLPPHCGQVSPSILPLPRQRGQRFSPVPGVAGAASSPGAWDRSVMPAQPGAAGTVPEPAPHAAGSAASKEFRLRFALAATLLPFFAAPAQASEIFAGAFVHDVATPLTKSGQEDGVDLHLGWRGERIEALRFVGAPSPHVFASINTAGDANFLGAGIGWKIGGRVYVRPGIGLAIHDGPDADEVTPDRIDFGSRLVFVPEVAVGWRIGERWSAEASWVHYSHAQLFSRHNPGSDSFGIRVNYRFR